MNKLQIQIEERTQIIDAIINHIEWLNTGTGYNFEYTRVKDVLTITAPNVMSFYKLGLLTAEIFSKNKWPPERPTTLNTQPA
jgi:hypothetical protein